MAPGRVLLVDDRLLLSILLDSPSPGLRRLRRRRPVYTSGLWYYRLCHAVRSDTVIGALSGPLQAAPPTVRAAVATSLVALPDDIGLLGLRDLAPVMAELVEHHRLNAMSLEALAAATFLPADLAIASTGVNPALIDAATAGGLRVDVVDP